MSLGKAQGREPRAQVQEQQNLVRAESQLEIRRNLSHRFGKRVSVQTTVSEVEDQEKRLRLDPIIRSERMQPRYCLRQI